MQNTSRQLPATARGMTNNNDNDGNGSDDGLDDCFQSSIGPSSDHVLFDKMERALDIALQPNGDNDFRSSSLDGCSGDLGNIVGMQCTANPNSDSRNADDKSIQTEGDANRLAKAKTQALSLKAKIGDKSMQQQDSPSRFYDEDYVANMIADIRRRRGKKKIQQTYWQTYDSEQRELDGKSSAPVSSYADDKIMDNSTIFSGLSSYYSESEDDESAMDESYGSYYDQRRRHSPRRSQNRDILEMINDLCVGNARCDISHRVTRTQRDRGERIRGKHNAKGEGDAQEDATLEGTTFSEYTREDTTLAGTLFSGTTKEETIMSGFTTEYDMPTPIKSSLLTEPNFLSEDEDGEEENESAGDSAFAVIHNLCSNNWFRCGKDGDNTVKKVDNNANESKVTAQSVKEHFLDRIQQSCSQGLEETTTKEETTVQDAKVQQECLNTRNESMESSVVIMQRSQNELKAIYDECNKAKSKCNKPTTLQLDSTKRTSVDDDDDDDETVEMSNRKPKNESIEVVETSTPTKQTRKWFRPKFFSPKKKKSSPVQIEPTKNCLPVSPARTAETIGTSVSSDQSSKVSLDEDDDVYASYAELAITRTRSKTLVSI